MKANNKYINIDESKEIPFHFHFLQKEAIENRSDNLSFISYIKVYNADGMVNSFYKTNSNIILPNQDD